MAKGFNKRRGKFKFAGDEDVTVDDSYTTSSGVKLKLHPVSPVLLQLIEQNVPAPECPTYTAETAFGTVEIHKHNKTTAETEEERHAWKTYAISKYRREAELTKRSNRLLLTKGVEVPEDLETTKFPEWEEIQKFCGIEIPADKMEKRYHMLTTEVIVSPDDIVNVIERIMMLIGVDEETLRAAEDSFRSPVAT